MLLSPESAQPIQHVPDFCWGHYTNAVLVPEEASAPGRRSIPMDVGGDSRTPSPRSLGCARSNLQVGQQFLAVPCTELFHVWFSC